MNDTRDDAYLLNKVSLDKLAIKTAIEAKKGTALVTPNDFGTYASEIDSIVLGEVESKEGTKEWYIKQRNPEWLPIDHLITEADKAQGKIVMLMPVFKFGSWFKFRTNQTIKIDWGDGNIEIKAKGYQEHTWDFDSINSPILANGSKQVIITLVPNGNEIMNYFIVYGYGTKKSTSALEVKAAGDFLYLRTTGFQLLELLELDGKVTSNDTLSSSLMYVRKLKYLKLKVKSTNYTNAFREMLYGVKYEVDLTNTENMSYMFYNSVVPDFDKISFIGELTKPTTALYMYGVTRTETIPAIDYKLISAFYLFAYGAMNLSYLPLIDMRNSTNNKRFAESCINLSSINIINCKSSISFKACYLLYLDEIINLGLTGLVDMTGEASQELNIALSGAGQELKSMGDDGTYHYKGTDYTKAQILSIFIDKNWTVTY